MNQQSDTKEKAAEVNAADKLIIQSLARLDSLALGVAVGAILGLAIFAATNILVFKGGEVIGPTLALLDQYFVGYEVTPIGSLIGLAYGFATGFIIGWLGATLRNFIFRIYINIYKLKTNMSGINEFIDNP